MKVNVPRRSLSSRTFIFLILLGICFISVLTYTATFADGWHGWGNGGFPWSGGHGQNCGSGATQGCNPFAHDWPTCTSTADQNTPTVSQGSGTPTDGWRGWRGWRNCGQNGATPSASVIPCTSPTAPPIGTPTPLPSDSTQASQPTTIPCNPPISTVPVPTVLATPTSGVQPPIPSGTPTSTSTPVSGNDPQSQAAQAVFAQINQERASQGLPAMQWSDQLQQSAHTHNVALVQSNLSISEIFPASGDGYAHQLPGEPPFGDRITNAGLRWSSAAENVGFSSSGDPTSAATGLNTSMFNEQPPDDGHRQNILSGNTLVGVDVFVDTKNQVWLTEDFAKPA